MDIEVKPQKWILENRIGYNNEIYKTFNRNKYNTEKEKEKCKCDEQICDIDIKTIKLFPHQRIIKDYMQIESPYRGVLVYHELGSGKSAASIAAAECFMEKKQIIVMTPASLAKNYENELMKISTIGINMKREWSLVKIKGVGKSKKLIEMLKSIGIEMKFIKKDNLIWLPLYDDSLKEDLEIKKNKINYDKLDTLDKKKVDETVLHIIRNKYKFISYNGLTQKMVTEMDDNYFEDTFIIVDEIHNFINRIVNGSKIARQVYNKLMIAKKCKMVLLSGTPIINNPYEIATLINLIRGQMEENSLKLLENSQEPTNKILNENLSKSEIIRYVDYIYYNNKMIKISLLPKDYKRTDKKKIEIKKELWENDEEKILKLIKEEINKIENIKVGEKITKEVYYSLPNKDEDFNKQFIDNTDEENPKVKNMDLFKRRILGIVSYYRTSGSELFPKLLPIKINYLDLTDHQLSVYDEVRTRERKIEEGNKFKKGTNTTNIFGQTSSVYRAYSRMVCNFAFPNEIKRVFPQDIRKILKKELDLIEEDKEKLEEDKEIESWLEEEKKKKIKDKAVIEYEKNIENILKDLENDDYLSKENLKKYYSPKYAKMLEDIEKSPGTVLIYSQFRSVEGLGIFTKVLNNIDYKEIKIIKTENGYKFEDLEIFSEKYDNKRYIQFSNDREKTNQLMNLYNGEFSLLDKNLFSELPKNIKDNKNIQLKGQIVKIMMITQSGAEGISLKNVRRVLIMEYFWNSVRINQVIGRAVRTCSHELLDKKDRNVEVFCYLMKLTKEQLKNNFTIKAQDNGKTTDEYIYEKAKKKEDIINKFLNMLKSSSFDCIINSEINKPISVGYKCYNWPINVNMEKLSYTKNINEDNKILKYKKYMKLKKDKGKVVLINNKKYVELNNNIYDYNSYKNAGILLKMPIVK